MKRIRIIIGLCLVAVFAMSAVAVASASAAEISYPNYKHYVKKAKGNYTAKTCPPSSKVSGTGKYELVKWTEGERSAFTSKSTGGTFTIEGKVVRCTRTKT